MDFIIVPRSCGQSYCIRFNRWYHFILPIGLLGLIVAAAIASGYYLSNRQMDEPLLTRWRHDIAQQRLETQTLHQETRADINTLSQRVGSVQAHVGRLEALGARLVELANLDPEEFDFATEPGRGGPHQPAGTLESGISGVKDLLDSLTQRLEVRELQLRALDELIMSRKLHAEVRPGGRPVQSGWISSRFGKRTDPFTGEPEFHKGVDIAGTEGSDVIAIGAGVVTWAGNKSGYGKFVEIDHGGGLLTRYAHHKKLLVKTGDVVKKGQVIAKLGNTGRSTGPHIHFEVIKDGRPVNPSKYLHNNNSLSASLSSGS